MTFLHRAVSSLFIVVILVLAALGPQLANLRTPEVDWGRDYVQLLR